MEKVNKFLVEEYWEKHNNKFSKEPLSKADFHIPLSKDKDLKNIICYNYVRKISFD